MTERLCPVCGSPDIKEEKVVVALEEPFGGQANVETHEVVCSVCGSRGDFFNENEEIMDNAYKSLKQKSIENILNDFIDHRVSMAGIERALGIPQRTLTKWKNGTSAPTASGLALMRFLRLFPWLLGVAETKYDYNEAQKIHIKAAVNQFLSLVSFDEKGAFNPEIGSAGTHFYFYMAPEPPVIDVSSEAYVEAGVPQPSIARR